VQQVSQSVFGQFVRSGVCPRCEGAGRIVESPCATCDGAGRLLEERTVEVDVPAGIEDGQRIRMRGEGHAGSLGGPAGDILVQVRVRHEAGIERDGSDLHAIADLTMTEAALGATVTVPGPEGEVEVEVPAGTQPGSVHVLKGRGMPVLQSGRRGDFNVHVRVLIPRSITPEQRALLETLGADLGDVAYRDDDEGFFDRLKSAFR
jgi:molecular chaperone DnaJ